MRAWLLIFLVAGLGIAPSSAQDATSTATPPPPPPPPYVGTLTGNFTFVKKLTYKPQPPSPKSSAAAEGVPPVASQPNLKELDAEQVKDVRRDKRFYVDGTNTEIWRFKNIRFLLNSQTSDRVLVAFPSPTGYEDAPDFGELEWVNAAAFQGVKDFGGKSCYLYKSGDQTVWIDKSTSLPLYFESSLMQVTYSYRPPPDEVLQLPPLFAAKYRQVQRAWSGQSR